MAKSKSKSKFSLNTILMAAVYAVLGLLLLILQGGSLGIIMTVVGVMLIGLGLVDVFKEKQLLKGVLEAIIGIAIIVCGWTIAEVVLLILGIVLIVKGVMELIKNIKGGFAKMLSPIITIVIGVLLVIAKWALLDVMCIIAGAILIVNAVLVILGKK